MNFRFAPGSQPSSGDGHGRHPESRDFRSRHRRPKIGCRCGHRKGHRCLFESCGGSRRSRLKFNLGRAYYAKAALDPEITRIICWSRRPRAFRKRRILGTPPPTTVSPSSIRTTTITKWRTARLSGGPTTVNARSNSCGAAQTRGRSGAIQPGHGLPRRRPRSRRRQDL